MCERLDDLGESEVAVVFFDSTDRLADYRRHHGIPDRVTLLRDPDRTAYQAFSLDRGAWWKVWGPRTWLSYARLMRSGRSYQRHEGDSLQLGGDFVVDGGGTVVYANRPPDPDSRPPVADLVAAATSS